MAIYIQLNRTDDDDSSSIYEFGPAEIIIGHVVVSKPDGAVSLLDIHADFERGTDFYLSRIRRTFEVHAGAGVFPDRTSYCA
jgi:hypothetical protein